VTITAAPGYELTFAGVSDAGAWATEAPGAVDVTVQGGIVDSATGLSIDNGSLSAGKQNYIVGDALASGAWFAGDNFGVGFAGSNQTAVKELTIQFARTWSADSGLGGNALIGNYSFPFSSGLSVYYTAQLVPEPETYAVFSLGLIMLAVMSRRMQRR
jgi:hypothetical protein